MKNWRLTSEFGVLIINGTDTRGNILVDNIAIFPVEKKTYSSSIKRVTKFCKTEELRLVDKKFNLKINEDLSIMVKSDSLPDKNKYYKVYNYLSLSENVDNLGKIVSTLNIEKGEILDTEFEPIFSDDYVGLVKFTNDKDEDYKSYLNELDRRTRFDMFKKTKNLIPGHKYETLEKSIIYLGSVFTSRVGNTIKDDVTEFEEVYLYVEELKDTDKTILDILKTRKFSEFKFGIKELRKISPMADSGEVLVNDIPKDFDIRDYIENMLDLCNKEYILPIDKSNITKFNTDNGSLIDYYLPFFYYTSGKFNKVGEDTRLRIRDITKKIMVYQGLRILNQHLSYVKGGGLYSSSELKLEGLVSLYSTIVNELMDCNNTDRMSYFFDYYSSILRNILGKDEILSKSNPGKLDEEVFKEISSINHLIEANLIDDIEKYNDVISAIGYYKYNIKGYVSIRSKSNHTYYASPITSIESVYGNGRLTEELIDLVTRSINGEQEIVNGFKVKNVGTIKSPKTYVSISITLKDIISKYKKLGSKVPDNLISDIINNKFSYFIGDFEINPEGIGTTIKIQ